MPGVEAQKTGAAEKAQRAGRSAKKKASVAKNKASAFRIRPCGR